MFKRLTVQSYVSHSISVNVERAQREGLLEALGSFKRGGWGAQAPLLKNKLWKILRKC